MTFDPSPVLNSEQWAGIANDPAKLEKAQAKLFDQYVSASPERQKTFQAAKPEEQTRLRGEFNTRIETKYPEQFKALVGYKTTKVPSATDPEYQLRFKIPADLGSDSNRFPTGVHHAGRKFEAEEMAAREAAAEAWAANRGPLGRFWDHSVAGGSLTGEIADSIVRGIRGEKYPETRMARARDAVRMGKEAEKAGWASETLAPVLSDLPVFMATRMNPAVLLPAMELAHQTKDKWTGEGELSGERVLKAAALGSIFKWLPLPKFLKGEQGGGLSRMGQRIAGSGVKATAAATVEPTFEAGKQTWNALMNDEEYDPKAIVDLFNPKQVADSWALFVALDTLGIIGAGVQGRQQTLSNRLSKGLQNQGVRKPDADKFAKDVVYAPGAANFNTVFKRAKDLTNKDLLQQVARKITDQYANRSPGPGANPPADATTTARTNVPSRAGPPASTSGGEPAPLAPAAVAQPAADGQPPARPVRALAAPAIRDLPAMIEQPAAVPLAKKTPPALGAPAEPPAVEPTPAQPAAEPGPSQLRTVDFPIVEFPLAKIKLSKDVPNFKEDANPDTGEVRGKELQGSFDRRGTGPIVVWERSNGDFEVISGRHRLALARRSGEETIPSQVVREADGWDQARAMILDAELNIRDGQGTTRDYADYFRARGDLTEAQARQGNLLREAKGITGWHIGKGASDDLYAAYRAGKVAEPKAAAIAEIAPGDKAVQAAAMVEARGLSVQDLREFTKSLMAAPRSKPAGGQQGDLFGFDDTILKESKAIAKQAGKAISEAMEQERTLAQAIRRGDKLELTAEQADRLEITDRRDRGQLDRALATVQAERSALERWHTDRELQNRFRKEAGLPIIGQPEPQTKQTLESRSVLLAKERLSELKPNEIGYVQVRRKIDGWKRQYEAYAMDGTLLGTSPRIAGKDSNPRKLNKRKARYIPVTTDIYDIPESSKFTADWLYDEMRKMDDERQGKRFPSDDQGQFFSEASPARGSRRAASPRAEPSAEAAMSVNENWPGGPLEDLPRGAVRPEDDRTAAMPVELPEMMQLYKALVGGQYPKIRQRMGDTMGLFIHRDGLKGSGKIELSAEIFDLVTFDEKKRMADQAKAQADALNAADPTAKVDWKDIYRPMVEQAYRDAAKKNPVLASKVMAHELMHFVDWLPLKTLQKGNILGHIASFKHYMMGQLAGSWEDQFIDGPYRRLTDADKARLRREVEKEMKSGAAILRQVIKEVPVFAQAKITPEMVLQIWNSNEARTTFPELYAFIAKLDPAEKKAVVKSAMAGAVHDVLKAVAGQQQIGTRQEIELVAEYKPIDPAELMKAFHARVEQEMRARGIIWKGAIVNELKPLIAWWRGSSEMEEYFSTGTEMYAEAGSIFLNNPAAVMKRAPMYYRAMMTWMENNPEWYKRYHQLQDDIKSGKIYADRVKNLRESVLAATETQAKLDEVANRKTMREHWDAFLYTFGREFGPVQYRLKKIDNPNQRWRVKQAISQYLYRKAHHELYLGRVRNEVIGPMIQSNLDTVDLFEYMFHQHVVNNRDSIANPYGWTSKASGERLAEMAQQLGPERFKALEAGQKAFWKVRQEEVIDKLERAGIFDDETMQVIRERQFYATIAPVRGDVAAEPDTIAAMLEARHGTVIGNIYKQVGYLGNIKNPFLATMQKDLALLNMAYREPAKRAISEVLRSSPAWNKEWQRADWRFTGRRLEPRDVRNSRVGTLYYMHKGKIEAWYGPRALVDQFMFGDTIESNLLAQTAYHLSRHFQNLWTQLNYGFWPVAYARDIGSFRDQMPGTRRFGKRSYWHYRRKALAAAKSSVLGRPDNLAKLSLRKGDLITHPDPRGDAGDDTPIDTLMRQYHIEPISWRGNDPGKANLILRTLRHYWEIYKSWGQTRERAMKIAGRMYLEEHHPGMPEGQKSELIHEMSGSPDFLQKGRGNAIINGVFPFYNPIKEGVYSTFKRWRERPGESFYKFMMYTILPLLGIEALRRGLLAGVLGDDENKEVSDMLNSIPRYDWDNYKCIPLGWADKANKKVAYLRVPMHEAERVARGAVAKLLRADEDPMNMGDLLNVAGGQIPGLNPLLKVGTAWYSYKATGRAPHDMYTGSKIMSDDQAQAGRGDVEMWKYTANNLGAGIAIRFDKAPLDAAEPTWMEKVLRLPIISNSLGRWVKISNRGVTDRLEPITREVETRRAQTRLDVQDSIRTVVDGGKMSASDAIRFMNDPYYAEYYATKMKDVMMMRHGGPEVRAILQAPSKESQTAIMRELLEQP